MGMSRIGIQGYDRPMTASSPLQDNSHAPLPHAPDQGQMPERLKTVVLTGASGGIGLLIAKRLLAQNYHVIALCRSKPALETPSLTHIPCDLGLPDAVTQACALITQENKTVFAVIHCAGTIAPAPVAQADDKAIAAQIMLNLSSPIVLTRHLLPQMISAGEGRIVFVNSMAAVIPLSGSAVYAAAKSGLRNFALSLAQEVTKQGIHVSSVFPGAVQTEMLAREMQEGGSILNYVSTPLDPDLVAKTIVSQLAHPRAERFLPAVDGLFGRFCMMNPALLRLALPLLAYLGRRGYRKATGAR